MWPKASSTNINIRSVVLVLKFLTVLECFVAVMSYYIALSFQRLNVCVESLSSSNFNG